MATEFSSTDESITTIINTLTEALTLVNEGLSKGRVKLSTVRDDLTYAVDTLDIIKQEMIIAKENREVTVKRLEKMLKETKELFTPAGKDMTTKNDEPIKTLGEKMVDIVDKANTPKPSHSIGKKMCDIIDKANMENAIADKAKEDEEHNTKQEEGFNSLKDALDMAKQQKK